MPPPMAPDAPPPPPGANTPPPGDAPSGSPSGVGQIIAQIGSGLDKFGEMLAGAKSVPPEAQAEFQGIQESFKSFIEKLSGGGENAEGPQRAHAAPMPQSPQGQGRGVPAGPQGAMPMGGR